MNVLTRPLPTALDAAAARGWASELRELELLTVGLEVRAPGAFGHARRVGRIAGSIAHEMGLPREQVARVRRAGVFHDVGKVELPAEIINKPERLSEREFELVKGHAAAGARMVARTGDGELAAMVRHHHERYGGGGYPDGLAGERIPLGSRIIAVADTFDALTSARPYRPARGRAEALALLEREAGDQLDPAVVRIFRRRCSGRPGFSGRRRVAFAG